MRNDLVVKTDTLHYEINDFQINFRDKEDALVYTKYYRDNNLLSTTYFYWTKIDPYQSIVITFYLTGKINSINLRNNFSLTTTEFFDSGELKAYKFLLEDTINFISPDSYVIEYYKNGIVRTHYRLSYEKQKLVEYWDNGEIKITGYWISMSNLLVDGYKEFDVTGKLIMKGRYKIDGDIYSGISKKDGLWKYYRNKKLVEKEKW